MSAELLTLLEDHQPGQSEFQLDRFVVSMHGGTIFGCYRQAMRELRTRIEATKQDLYELEKAKLDLEEAELELEADLAKREARAQAEGPETLEIRRGRLEVLRLRMRIESLEAVSSDRARELGHIIGLVRGYRRMLGAPLTAARREELERETWVHAIKCAAAAHYIGIPPGAAAALPAEVASMIQALPPEMRLDVCSKVAAAPQARAALLGWWLDFGATVPEVEPISEEEVRRLAWHTPSLPPS